MSLSSMRPGRVAVAMGLLAPLIAVQPFRAESPGSHARAGSVPVAALAMTSVGAREAQEASVRIEIRGHVQVSADRPGMPHIEPHVARDAEDPEHLVAAVATIGGTTSVAALTSFDGGLTWSRAALPDCWLDPWVAFLSDGGVRVACIGDADRPPIVIYASAD